MYTKNNSKDLLGELSNIVRGTMEGKDHLLDKDTEIIGNGDIWTIRANLIFPLALTYPCASMNSDRSMKQNGWLHDDDGVAYTESTELAEGPFRRKICAVLLQKMYQDTDFSFLLLYYLFAYF